MPGTIWASVELRVRDLHRLLRRSGADHLRSTFGRDGKRCRGLGPAAIRRDSIVDSTESEATADGCPATHREESGAAVVDAPYQYEWTRNAGGNQALLYH